MTDTPYSSLRGERSPVVRRRRVVMTAALGGLMAVALPLTGSSPVSAAASSRHASINCAKGATVCTEVSDSEQAFGEGVYVGHDEPSTLFYSGAPGSGNQMRYQLTLPKDPSTSNPTARWEVIQLRAASGLLVRYGDVRHAVLSRAGVDVQAGQRFEHR